MMAVKPETNCETCKGSISRINFQCKNGIEKLPVNQCKYTYLSREEETFSCHDTMALNCFPHYCAVYHVLFYVMYSLNSNEMVSMSTLGYFLLHYN